MKQSIDYTDIPIYGGFTPRGDIKILKGSAAVENSLKYFLAGARPDLFNLAHQGVIRQYLMKPLAEVTALDIKVAVTSAIDKSFLPRLVITTLNVIPDYENNAWTLQIQARTQADYLPVFLEEVILSKSQGMFNG